MNLEKMKSELGTQHRTHWKETEFSIILPTIKSVLIMESNTNRTMREKKKHMFVLYIRMMNGVRKAYTVE